MNQIEAVVALIRSHVDRNGYPPSVRQLAAFLEVSPSTVHKRLTQAVEQGLIERVPGVARAIRIKEKP